MHIQTHKGFIFHYNGDYSGDVIISKEDDTGYEIHPEMIVSFEALKDFIVEYVRDVKATKIEAGSADEVLGLL